MSKQEFLAQLRKGLYGLPQADIEERIAFYSEMIDDMMEEGLSEKEAVSNIGSVDDLVEQIISDISVARIVKEKITPNRSMRAWEIVLLVLGAPIWLSLAVAAAAVILSIYASLWAVIVSLWAVFGSIIGCAFGMLAAGVGFAFVNATTGAAMISAGLICAGLSIFLFYGCKTVTTGILLLTKKSALKIKKCFVKKEVAQ